MRTDEALAGFRTGWQEYNGLTHIYKRRQMRELAELAAHQPQGDLLAVDGDVLRAWLEEGIADGLLASTVGQKLITIRPFYEWAFDNRLIDAERYLELKRVKKPRNTAPALPRPYSARERERFWLDFAVKYPWVRDKADTMAHLRGQHTEERGRKFFERWIDRRSAFARARPYCLRVQAEAMVQLAMVAGLRRIEVWNLPLEDMDPDNEYIVVQGARKGDGREKERVVPWLTDSLRHSVDRWLEVRAAIIEREPPQKGPHEHPWLFLFISGFGRPGDKMGWVPFDRTMRAIGGGYLWHRMRHTAATEMFRAGYPAPAIQKILGHSDISTTMQYTKLLREDLVHQARVNRERYERAMDPAA